MKDCIMESPRSIPVKMECDVLVAGGGIAGIAAALSAARMGADVLLVEKQCVVGGLATSGLVTIYLPLCDGMGHQVSYGIAEELIKLSVKDYASLPKEWTEENTVEERKKQRYEVGFNPSYFALYAEQLLLKEHVRILYDTSICDVVLKEGKLTHVIVENQSGRNAIELKAAVDATGTAFLFQKAGVNTRIYAPGNSVAGWYYASTEQGLKLVMLGFADQVAGTERDYNITEQSRRYQAVDTTEISEFIIASHKATLEDIKKKVEKKEILEPATIVHMPQYRMIRCICGEKKMEEHQSEVKEEDSIGMVGNWTKSGPCYQVPYACLYNKKVTNLYAAGRCVSTDDFLWDVMRVIPACAVTGEAAGTAAALTKEGQRPGESEVQTALRAHGQKLFFHELKGK